MDVSVSASMHLCMCMDVSVGASLYLCMHMDVSVGVSRYLCMHMDVSMGVVIGSSVLVHHTSDFCKYQLCRCILLC